MSENYLFECRGLSKSFGPTKAVVEVDFSLPRGEIRALIGENGSGKSTMCSLITGMLKMDSGAMTFKGESFTPGSLLDSQKAGVSILLQETGTIGALTVAENLFLGREQNFIRHGRLDKKAMIDSARAACTHLGLDIDPSLPAASFSFEERKLIEVVRAMQDDPELLIVDETTTALSQAGREIIYSLFKKLKAEDKSAIFITHDLGEMMAVCDSATILRDGHYVETISKEQFDESRIRQSMIGRQFTSGYYRTDENDESLRDDDIVLDVRGVSYGRSVRKVSFKLRRGEILGIGGLTDCGMHDLGQLMFGALRCDEGEVVHIESGEAIRSPRQAIGLRIAYIPKDRDQASVFLQSEIRDNVAVAASDKLQKHGFIMKRAEKELVLRETGRLSVKMQDIKQLVKSLSGGNKQKIALSKWLANDSEILIMDCPTRGIDVGIKAAVYRLMEQLKGEGRSIIMISEELPELIGMSDRVLIMKNGRLSAEFFRKDGLTESKIIETMI